MSRSSGRPLTVVVADDDAGVRAALTGLLHAEACFTVVGQAADGDEAVALATEHRAELVLIDGRMPGGGPPLARRLTALAHRPTVVALSAHADTASWTGMIAAGAAGYLVKADVATDLPSLLRRCVAGQIVVTVTGASDVLRRLLAERKAAHDV